MSKDVMSADGTSFALEGDTEITVRNQNPATLEYTFRMARGSFIRFTVPAGGEFTLQNFGDIVSGDMTVLNISPYGPRAIDKD